MFILSALAVFSFSHVSYSPTSENAAQPVHEYNRQELTKASDYILPLKGVNEQLLRRKGYLASYNRYTKEPNWVAWHLTKELLSGTVKRPGNAWHEDPQVPNYGRRGNGPTLKASMCIAIEPMITMGKRDIWLDKDRWTIRTQDHKPAAHFEHTVAVCKGRAEILSSFEEVERIEGKLY
jgi:hypothetical protein